MALPRIKNPLNRDEFKVIFKKGVATRILDCDKKPSETSDTPWLLAEGDYRPNEDGRDTAGKWMVRFAADKVDAMWEVVKQAVLDGKITSAKVSCADPKYRDHVIMVTVTDADDMQQVYDMYQTLIELGLINNADDCQKHKNQQAKFKADQQTKNGVVDEKKVTYLYTSADMENWAKGELRYLPNVVMSEPVVLADDLPRFKDMNPSLRAADEIFSVKMGNTWRTKNPAYKSKEETADVFRAAMHRNGLPMATMLDGCSRHASNSDIQAIANSVIETLADLVDELNGRNVSDDAVQQLVKDKYKKLDASLQNRFASDASVSAIAMYRNADGQLMTIGFGTGDTMVVLRNQDRYDTIIAAKNVVETSAPMPLPRPNLKAISMERVLANLEVVHQPVDASDKLIFLTDGAYEPLLSSLGHTKTSSVTKPDTIDTSILGGNTAKLDIDMLAQAERTIKQNFEAASGADITIGDDAAVAILDVGAAIRAEDHFKQVFVVQNADKDEIEEVSEASAKDWAFPASLGMGVLFALGVAIATPFVIAASAITLSAGAVVVLGVCAALVAGLLVAALVMGAFKLYDYCTRAPQAEDDDDRKAVQEAVNAVAEVNKKVEREKSVEKRAEIKQTEVKIDKKDEDEKKDRIEKGKEKESSSVLKKEGEEEVVLMDAPVAKSAVSLEELFSISAKMLPSAGQFSPQSVPAEPLLPSEGNVFLIDGTEMLKEQADAIYNRLQDYKMDTAEAKARLSLLFDACSRQDNKMLTAQSRVFSQFRARDTDDDNEYPIIKSDNTIDKETRRILLLALEKTPQGIKIVKPFVEPVAIAAPGK